MSDWVGEFDYIRSQLAPLSAEAYGAAGLTDDGAILDLGPGERLAVTADTVIESYHFPKGEDPALAARKALRVNLSDLAAMGAQPFAYTTSVVWPHGEIQSKADGFVSGLAQDQEEFGVRLIGGDTTRANAPWTISITAFGRIPTGQSLRRNRARAGDLLVVTGTIGDSGLGLGLIQDEWNCTDPVQADFLIDRYRLPQPRIEAGKASLRFANAAIDISDGILSEARHLAIESGLSASIDLDKLPVSEAAQTWLMQQPDRQNALVELATHGDDYELVVAVPPDRFELLAEICKRASIQISVLGQLGVVEATEPLQVLVGGAAIVPEKLGFTHF